MSEKLREALKEIADTYCDCPDLCNCKGIIDVARAALAEPESCEATRHQFGSMVGLTTHGDCNHPECAKFCMICGKPLKEVEPTK
jgi:hypothetical protein